jgi:hypothetical protein
MDQFRRHKQATVQDAARPAGLAAIQHLPHPSPKRAKAKARSELDKQVDFYMDRAEVIAVSVPFIYVYVASSLGAASALMQIERHSEARFIEYGDPWVSLDTAEWLDYTGLSGPEWVAARQRLRELGLVAERRRYCDLRAELVVDIQFCPEAFAKAKAGVRQAIREQLMAHQGGQGGPSGQNGPNGPDRSDGPAGAGANTSRPPKA